MAADESTDRANDFGDQEAARERPPQSMLAGGVEVSLVVGVIAGLVTLMDLLAAWSWLGLSWSFGRPSAPGMARFSALSRQASHRRQRRTRRQGGLWDRSHTPGLDARR